MVLHELIKFTFRRLPSFNQAGTPPNSALSICNCLADCRVARPVFVARKLSKRPSRTTQISPIVKQNHDRRSSTRPRLGRTLIPRALVPVNVGRSTVNLYPIIDPSMATHERAHAYHINKTALSSQNIDLQVQLDALGHQLNLSATVKCVINDWLRYFYDRWCDFSKLQILSFHNIKRDEVNDTTDATDSSILLPVIDGAYGTCRNNLKFVRVQLSVNFVDLVTAVNPGPTTLRIEYFIKLPQTTRQMTNGAGTVYNLTTFHGASELRTLDAQGVQREITDFTLQDGPVELQAASFGATSVLTESSAIRTEIQEKILRLASSSICHTMFTELCPGYSNQPHAALEHILQVHNDKDGNPVSSSVQAYYQQLLNASRPFTSQRESPVSVCSCFVSGLDPRLLTAFCHNFPKHSDVQPLDAAHQRKVLQEMLKAAQSAEDDLIATQKIAREAVGLSQGFLANSQGGGGLKSPVPQPGRGHDQALRPLLRVQKRQRSCH